MNSYTHKIQMLLNKTVENGCTVEEATEAALKVQELMAKYNIEAQELAASTTTIHKKEDIVMVWSNIPSKQWSSDLQDAITNNFCCQPVTRTCKHKRFFGFVGYKTQAEACRSVYNSTHTFLGKKENYEYHKAQKQNKHYKGFRYDYSKGFILGLKAALDRQSIALMLITPQEVKDKTNDITKGRSANLPAKRITSDDTKSKGYKDGYDFGKRKEIETR